MLEQTLDTKEQQNEKEALQFNQHVVNPLIAILLLLLKEIHVQQVSEPDTHQLE